MSSATTDAPPPTAPPDGSLAEVIRGKLNASPVPLKLADVAKGLNKPAKVKKPEFEALVRQAIEELFGLGRAFRYPSGPKGAERFWAKDEKQTLQDAVVAAAVEPKALSALKTAVGKAAKGTDPGFIEEVIRGLIGEDRLFEHPPKGKQAGPLFATHAPPPPTPPLELPKFKKKVDGLVKTAAGLVKDAAVSVEDLLAVLRARLSPEDGPIVVGLPGLPTPKPELSPASVGPDPELRELILAAVADPGPVSVLPLPDLRRQVPERFRGPVFDATVLQLADEQQVRIYQDADPLKYTPEERAERVTDASGHVFATIAKRG